MVAAGTALTVLIPALRLGGAVDDTALPGIPAAGPVTAWLLPLVTMLATTLGVVTVGLTVTAAFLLPGDGASVAAHGWLLTRRATWAALMWASASVALIVPTVSDVLGVPVPGLSRPVVTSFALSIDQGRALLVRAVLALAAAVLTRAGVSRDRGRRGRPGLGRGAAAGRHRDRLRRCGSAGGRLRRPVGPAAPKISHWRS